VLPPRREAPVASATGSGKRLAAEPSPAVTSACGEPRSERSGARTPAGRAAVGSIPPRGPHTRKRSCGRQSHRTHPPSRPEDEPRRGESSRIRAIPGAGLEPARLTPSDFKSDVSTDSTTRAYSSRRLYPEILPEVARTSRGEGATGPLSRPRCCPRRWRPRCRQPSRPPRPSPLLQPRPSVCDV
jgi:hypothetical protein